jgi:hypothetical protein
MQATPSAWSSLEIAKLTVSALTPIVVVVIGLWLNRRLKAFEYLQWTNQKVTEKRIAIFDQLAPLLNDVYCYFTFRGSWKDLTPIEVVSKKREMDRIVHVNAPLFSPEFVRVYNYFIDACYETYTGWGRNARLRTAWERRQEAANSAWKEEWKDYFSDDRLEPQQVETEYFAIMSCLSAEIGVGLRSDPGPSGFIPANIR